MQSNPTLLLRNLILQYNQRPYQDVQVLNFSYHIDVSVTGAIDGMKTGDSFIIIKVIVIQRM